MSSLSPVAQTIGMLFSKLTAEELIDVFAAVNAMPSTAHTVQTPTSEKLSTPRKKRSKKLTSEKIPGRSIFAVNNGGAQQTLSGKIAPARPLNSWMAFRSHYSPIFKNFQQKQISGLLTRLWQNDPFKAKWSIIAKAYSTIREYTTKEAAPLDTFLSLVCPHIGMLRREEYLDVMGWVLSDDNGTTKMDRSFTPNLSAFPNNILTTNLSAEQVVAYCHHVKYIDQRGSREASHVSYEAAVLTMAAQPPAMESESTAPVFASMQEVQPVNDSLEALFPGLNDKFQTAVSENNNNAVGSSAALRQAVHDIDQTGTRYPFNDQFDPYNPNTTSFDPFSGHPNLAFSITSPGTYVAPPEMENPETFDFEQFLNNDAFEAK